MKLPAHREVIYCKLVEESSHTPAINLSGLAIPNNNRILLKLEFLNPVRSIHLRVYPYVFRRAELAGYIRPGQTPVIEASLGNAGAAFVYCANVLGYNSPFLPRVIVPENITAGRHEQLTKLRAEISYSPTDRYNLGYVEALEREVGHSRSVATHKLGGDPSRLYVVTKTEAGARLAYKALVDESLASCIEYSIPVVSHFVGIVGSGTSISGIGSRLKEVNPDSQVFAAEAEDFRNTTSLLSQGKPLPLDVVPKGFPLLAAIGVPHNRLGLNVDIIDGVIQFDRGETQRIMEIVYSEIGFEVGLSTAGTLLSALKLAEEIEDRTILVCAYDEMHKWI
jgi:cysteine synthase